MLRLPNDLKLLQNIVNLLYSFEQLNSDSKTRPVTTSKLKASSQAHSDKLKKMLAERKPPFSHPSHSGTAYHNDIIHEIANLHSINLVDLINLEVYNNNCHTNNTALQTTANSLTLNSIIKKLDKPIVITFGGRDQYNCASDNFARLLVSVVLVRDPCSTLGRDYSIL